MKKAGIGSQRQLRLSVETLSILSGGVQAPTIRDVPGSIPGVSWCPECPTAACA